jgi:hypothetical protein
LICFKKWKQVSSIHHNVTEIINIANFSCKNEDTNLLMTECSMITSKLGNDSFAKDTINNLFRKFAFEKIERSSCIEDTTTKQPKANSEEVICELSDEDKRYESISLT